MSRTIIMARALFSRKILFSNKLFVLIMNYICKEQFIEIINMQSGFENKLLRPASINRIP